LEELTKHLNNGMDIQTIMRNKEDLVLEPFFNSSQYWHFDELLRKTAISRSQLAQWLKKFEKKGIIKRVKQKGKMPYYVQNFDSQDFHQRKRFFALKHFYETGFLNHLAQCDAETIIIFGSFARTDWHDKSDIDLFVFGKGNNLNISLYEKKLKREVQLFHFRKLKDMNKLSPGLLPYIAAGDIIKGDLSFLKVKINA
jgi:predicted nucleotidyltransferase